MPSLFYRLVRRLALTGLCAFLCLPCACDDGSEDIVVDGTFASAGVYGSVTTASGEAVAAAIVWLGWRPGTSCDEPLSMTAPDTTDALGRCRIGFGTFGEGGYDVCTRLIAEPPEGSNLLPDTVVRTGIRIRSAAPWDSVEINLVLRPSAKTLIR